MKLHPTLNKNLFEEKKLEKIATRDGFGQGLVLVGRENKNVISLCADLTESVRMEDFKKEFPERFIECGLTEQNMISVASGLALSGKIPFAASFAVFSPALNWSQIRVNVLQNNANVKIVSTHAGISVGEDGMSHQGLEDIALMRCLPKMTIVEPCDALEAQKATIAIAKYQGAVYLRLAREKTPVFTTKETPFQIGRAEIFKKGKDVTILACGPLVYQALLAAQELEKEGISVEVINNSTIKPLDKKTILNSLKKTKALVTVENHQIMAGMGSAVLEVLARNFPVPGEMIGIEDKFGQSGSAQELLKFYGLTSFHIKKAVKKVLKRLKLSHRL